MSRKSRILKVMGKGQGLDNERPQALFTRKKIVGLSPDPYDEAPTDVTETPGRFVETDCLSRNLNIHVQNDLAPHGSHRSRSERDDFSTDRRLGPWEDYLDEPDGRHADNHGRHAEKLLHEEFPRRGYEKRHHSQQDRDDGQYNRNYDEQENSINYEMCGDNFDDEHYQDISKYEDSRNERYRHDSGSQNRYSEELSQPEGYYERECSPNNPVHIIIDHGANEKRLETRSQRRSSRRDQTRGSRSFGREASYQHDHQSQSPRRIDQDISRNTDRHLNRDVRNLSQHDERSRSPWSRLGASPDRISNRSGPNDRQSNRSQPRSRDGRLDVDRPNYSRSPNRHDNEQLYPDQHNIDLGLSNRSNDERHQHDQGRNLEQTLKDFRRRSQTSSFKEDELRTRHQIDDIAYENAHNIGYDETKYIDDALPIDNGEMFRDNISRGSAEEDRFSARHSDHSYRSDGRLREDRRPRIDDVDRTRSHYKDDIRQDSQMRRRSPIRDESRQGMDRHYDDISPERYGGRSPERFPNETEVKRGYDRYPEENTHDEGDRDRYHNDRKSYQSPEYCGDDTRNVRSSEPYCGDDTRNVRSPEPYCGDDMRNERISEPYCGDDMRNVRSSEPYCGDDTRNVRSPEPYFGDDMRNERISDPYCGDDYNDIRNPGQLYCGDDIGSPMQYCGDNYDDVRSPEHYPEDNYDNINSPEHFSVEGFHNDRSQSPIQKRGSQYDKRSHHKRDQTQNNRSSFIGRQRNTQRSLSPPGRGHRNTQRSLSPHGRGQRNTQRSLSPPGRGQRNTQRSLSPPGRGQRNTQRSLSPPGRGQRNTQRSLSPPGRGQRNTQRSLSRPGRCQRNTQRSFSPPGRGQRNTQRSLSPPERGQRNTQRSLSPPPKGHRNPNIILRSDRSPEINYEQTPDRDDGSLQPVLYQPGVYGSLNTAEVILNRPRNRRERRIANKRLIVSTSLGDERFVANREQERENTKLTGNEFQSTRQNSDRDQQIIDRNERNTRKTNKKSEYTYDDFLRENPDKRSDYTYDDFLRENPKKRSDYTYEDFLRENPRKDFGSEKGRQPKHEQFNKNDRDLYGRAKKISSDISQPYFEGDSRDQSGSNKSRSGSHNVGQSSSRELSKEKSGIKSRSRSPRRRSRSSERRRGNKRSESPYRRKERVDQRSRENLSKDNRHSSPKRRRVEDNYAKSEKSSHRQNQNRDLRDESKSPKRELSNVTKKDIEIPSGVVKVVGLGPGAVQTQNWDIQGTDMMPQGSNQPQQFMPPMNNVSVMNSTPVVSSPAMMNNSPMVSSSSMVNMPHVQTAMNSMNVATPVVHNQTQYNTNNNVPFAPPSRFVFNAQPVQQNIQVPFVPGMQPNLSGNFGIAGQGNFNIRAPVPSSVHGMQNFSQPMMNMQTANYNMMPQLQTQQLQGRNYGNMMQQAVASNALQNMIGGAIKALRNNIGAQGQRIQNMSQGFAGQKKMTPPAAFNSPFTLQQAVKTNTTVSNLRTLSQSLDTVAAIMANKPGSMQGTNMASNLTPISSNVVISGAPVIYGGTNKDKKVSQANQNKHLPKANNAKQVSSQNKAKLPSASGNLQSKKSVEQNTTGGPKNSGNQPKWGCIIASTKVDKPTHNARDSTKWDCKTKSPVKSAGIDQGNKNIEKPNGNQNSTSIIKQSMSSSKDKKDKSPAKIPSTKSQREITPRKDQTKISQNNNQTVVSPRSSQAKISQSWNQSNGNAPSSKSQANVKISPSKNHDRPTALHTTTSKVNNDSNNKNALPKTPSKINQISEERLEEMRKAAKEKTDRAIKSLYQKLRQDREMEKTKRLEARQKLESLANQKQSVNLENSSKQIQSSGKNFEIQTQEKTTKTNSEIQMQQKRNEATTEIQTKQKLENENKNSLTESASSRKRQFQESQAGGIFKSPPAKCAKKFTEIRPHSNSDKSQMSELAQSSVVIDLTDEKSSHELVPTKAVSDNANIVGLQKDKLVGEEEKPKDKPNNIQNQIDQKSSANIIGKLSESSNKDTSNNQETTSIKLNMLKEKESLQSKQPLTNNLQTGDTLNKESTVTKSPKTPTTNTKKEIHDTKTSSKESDKNIADQSQTLSAKGNVSKSSSPRKEASSSSVSKDKPIPSQETNTLKLPQEKSLEGRKENVDKGDKINSETKYVSSKASLPQTKVTLTPYEKSPRKVDNDNLGFNATDEKTNKSQDVIVIDSDEDDLFTSVFTQDNDNVPKTLSPDETGLDDDKEGKDDELYNDLLPQNAEDFHEDGEESKEGSNQTVHTNVDLNNDDANKMSDENEIEEKDDMENKLEIDLDHKMEQINVQETENMIETQSQNIEKNSNVGESENKLEQQSNIIETESKLEKSDDQNKRTTLEDLTEIDQMERNMWKELEANGIVSVSMVTEKVSDQEQNISEELNESSVMEEKNLTTPDDGNFENVPKSGAITLEIDQIEKEERIMLDKNNVIESGKNDHIEVMRKMDGIQSDDEKEQTISAKELSSGCTSSETCQGKQIGESALQSNTDEPLGKVVNNMNKIQVNNDGNLTESDHKNIVNSGDYNDGKSLGLDQVIIDNTGDHLNQNKQDVECRIKDQANTDSEQGQIADIEKTEKTDLISSDGEAVVENELAIVEGNNDAPIEMNTMDVIEITVETEKRSNVEEKSCDNQITNESIMDAVGDGDNSKGKEPSKSSKVVDTKVQDLNTSKDKVKDLDTSVDKIVEDLNNSEEPMEDVETSSCKIKRTSVCPIPGCGAVCFRLKRHAHTAHIPWIFRDGKWNQNFEKCGLVIRQLVMWILGARGKIEELVKLVNESDLMPKNVDFKENEITFLQKFCKHHKWPVMDAYTLRPINSPACFVHWRAMLCLLVYISEEKRNGLKEMYNQGTKLNMSTTTKKLCEIDAKKKEKSSQGQKPSESKTRTGMNEHREKQQSSQGAKLSESKAKTDVKGREREKSSHHGKHSNSKGKLEVKNTNPNSLLEEIEKKRLESQNKVTVQSAPMTQNKVTVHSASMAQNKVTVHSASMAQNKVTVHSAPMAQNKVTVQSAPMTQNKVTVHSASMAQNKVTVHSAPMAQNKVNVHCTPLAMNVNQPNNQQGQHVWQSIIPQPMPPPLMSLNLTGTSTNSMPYMPFNFVSPTTNVIGSNTANPGMMGQMSNLSNPSCGVSVSRQIPTLLHRTVEPVKIMTYQGQPSLQEKTAVTPTNIMDSSSALKKAEQETKMSKSSQDAKKSSPSSDSKREGDSSRKESSKSSDSRCEKSRSSCSCSKRHSSRSTTSGRDRSRSDGSRSDSSRSYDSRKESSRSNDSRSSDRIKKDSAERSRTRTYRGREAESDKSPSKEEEKKSNIQSEKQKSLMEQSMKATLELLEAEIDIDNSQLQKSKKVTTTMKPLQQRYNLDTASKPQTEESAFVAKMLAMMGDLKRSSLPDSTKRELEMSMRKALQEVSSTKTGNEETKPAPVVDNKSPKKKMDISDFRNRVNEYKRSLAERAINKQKDDFAKRKSAPESIPKKKPSVNYVSGTVKSKVDAEKSSRRSETVTKQSRSRSPDNVTPKQRVELEESMKDALEKFCHLLDTSPLVKSCIDYGHGKAAESLETWDDLQAYDPEQPNVSDSSAPPSPVKSITKSVLKRGKSAKTKKTGIVNYDVSDEEEYDFDITPVSSPEIHVYEEGEGFKWSTNRKSTSKIEEETTVKPSVDTEQKTYVKDWNHQSPWVVWQEKMAELSKEIAKDSHQVQVKGGPLTITSRLRKIKEGSIKVPDLVLYKDETEEKWKIGGIKEREEALTGAQPGGYGPPPTGQPPYGGGYPGQPAGGYPAPGGYGGAPPGIDPNVYQWFQTVDQDKSGHITAHELQQALVNGNWSHFNPETCRLMISLFDHDNSGTIQLHEFNALWNYIQQWKGVFERFDANRSGSIEAHELIQAYQQMGYNLSPQFGSVVIQKFDHMGTRSLTLDNFIQSCVMLKSLTDSFKQRDQQMVGNIRMSYEDFMTTAVFNKV